MAWPCTAALLHLINNGLTKGVLFLSAGNIHRAYGSKLTDDVRGAIVRVPLSASLFLAGFLAVTGSPPFAPFVSEFTIVNAAVGSGQYLAGGLFLLLLGIVFIGMGVTVLAVVQGTPPEQQEHGRFHDSISTGGPIILFMALVVLLGLYVPPPLDSLGTRRCRILGGKTMNGIDTFAALRTGHAIPRAQVPVLPFADFRSIVVEAVKCGQRIVALFGNIADSSPDVEVYARPCRQCPRAVTRWQGENDLGPVSLAHSRVSAGAPFRAGAGRAIRAPSRRPSLVQAGSLS